MLKSAGEIIQQEESAIRPRNGNVESDEGEANGHPKKKVKPNQENGTPKACPLRKPGMADDEDCLACGS